MSNFVTLDFETEFSDDYTLSKSTTEGYVRDARFKALGCAVKMSPDLPTRWWHANELPEFFASIDWSTKSILCHHANFDGLILSHHYNVRPKFWFDTLCMARLLLGNHLSVGLDALAKHFKLQAKTVPYNLFKGRSWEQCVPVVQEQIALGACHDVELTFELFKILGKQMPKEEYAIVDLVTRMFTEPCLRADMQILADVWRDEAVRKQKAMADLNVNEAELQSAEKFAELLRAEGVEIGYKPSPKHPDKTIYAFAKTDQFMRDLLEDEDDRIRTLAEARLGQKSNIMQTRAETLGRMGRRGPLCVYLRYAGAGTLRVSGGDGANWLNFKRRSPIRKAILAPEGYFLAPIDSSQIECRVLHFLAGGINEPVIQKFIANEDPYVDLATRFYGEQIYKPGKDDPRKDEMEAKRGMGKQGRLMCGYGAAGPKFKITAKNGLYGPSVDIPLEEATRFVKLYRQDNPSICAKNTGYWAQASRMIARLAGGDPCDWGPLHVENHRLYVPNGAPLIYDTLEYYKPPTDERHKYKEWEQDGFWRVKTRQGWKTMHGPKLTQNICEAVSRLIVSQAAIRIARAGYRILNWPYDELLCLIPRDNHEARHVEFLLGEMRREPTWLPGIPLDAEVSVGERYSK